MRAFATVGIEEIGLFTNNGFSEIYYFDYQTQCDAPLFPEVEELTNRSAKIAWQGNFDHLDYTLQYREKNASSDWYDVTTPREYVTVSDLKAETTYEFKVRGNCTFVSYGETLIYELTTLSEAASAYQGCAIEPDPILLDNQEVLPELFINDQFTAGDFPVTVLQVDNATAPFSGGGYVVVPWLGDTKISVAFEGIQINTDMQLLSGNVETTYDADWENVDGVGVVINGVISFFDILTEIIGLDIITTTSETIEELADALIKDSEEQGLPEEIVTAIVSQTTMMQTALNEYNEAVENNDTAAAEDAEEAFENAQEELAVLQDEAQAFLDQIKNLLITAITEIYNEGEAIGDTMIEQYERSIVDLNPVIETDTNVFFIESGQIENSNMKVVENESFINLENNLLNFLFSKMLKEGDEETLEKYIDGSKKLGVNYVTIYNDMKGNNASDNDVIEIFKENLKMTYREILFQPFIQE